MTAFVFDTKNDPIIRENLKRVGADSDLKVEARVQALQQAVAELLTALEKAGIKTNF
jgi:hypothetical protein